jgi:hypothetical protein
MARVRADQKQPECASSQPSRTAEPSVTFPA